MTRAKKTASQRVAQRHMRARFFGLLPNHIGWQDLSRYEKQLQWMFREGQHKVKGSYDSEGKKKIHVEAQGTNIVISGFKSSGSGYNYRTLVVEINGQVVKKTDDLKEVRKIVYETLSDLGLWQ